MCVCVATCVTPLVASTSFFMHPTSRPSFATCARNTLCCCLLQGLLKGKSFLGGSRPGAEDACVYAAVSSLPSVVLKAAPAAKGWLNTVGCFAPSMRASWGGGGGASAKGSAKKGEEAAAAAKAPVADKSRAIEVDDDVDSLFGDEDEAEEGGAAPARGTTMSRAEQMTAAKSAKDANKKVDR